MRLRDWLAPEDELVPFGPRAYAQDAADGRANPDLETEPAASGFWDGDTSMHTAVPGPGIFDGGAAGTSARPRSRRLAPVSRPALPSLHPLDWASGARARLALVGRISWQWAAATAAFVVLAVIALVIVLGAGSSGHHGTAAQAGIAEPAPAALSGTLGAIGTATRTAAVSNLRRLPHVDTGGRAMGAAVRGARALRVRDRRQALVSPAAVSSASTTASVETPTTTAAPAPVETTTAPSETDPAQSTSSPAPTTGSSGGSGGGGSSSSSSSQSRSNFGASGSLGPGSSPNG